MKKIKIINRKVLILNNLVVLRHQPIVGNYIITNNNENIVTKSGDKLIYK